MVTFAEVTRPSQVDGQHAPGLRFGDPRVVAVLAAIVGFIHPRRRRQPSLVRLVGTLLDRPYTGPAATYDLRRLKREGLITRIPGRHRYLVTSLDRRVAVVLTPGLTTLDPHLGHRARHQADWDLQHARFRDEYLDRQS